MQEFLAYASGYDHRATSKSVSEDVDQRKNSSLTRRVMIIAQLQKAQANVSP